MEKEQSECRSAVGGRGMLCDWSEALGSHLSSLVAINLHKLEYFCHLVKIMEQVITAKLKLHLSLLAEICFAGRVVSLSGCLELYFADRF